MASCGIEGMTEIGEAPVSNRVRRRTCSGAMETKLATTVFESLACAAGFEPICLTRLDHALFFAESASLHFVPEFVDVGFIDQTRREFDKFICGNDRLVSVVQLVEYVNRLVAILIRVLNNCGDHGAVLDSLQGGKVFVECQSLYFAKFPEPIERFENQLADCTRTCPTMPAISGVTGDGVFDVCFCLGKVELIGHGAENCKLLIVAR